MSDAEWEKIDSEMRSLNAATYAMMVEAGKQQQARSFAPLTLMISAIGGTVFIMKYFGL